jgi:hypothetical protein
MEIDGELAAYTEADHERDKAATEAAAKLALTRPAGQAVGCIAAAAWNNETFPLTGFNHQVVTGADCRAWEVRRIDS